MKNAKNVQRTRREKGGGDIKGVRGVGTERGTGRKEGKGAKGGRGGWAREWEGHDTHGGRAVEVCL